MKATSVLIMCVFAPTRAYDIDYFDRLRVDASLRSSAQKSPANADLLWEVTDVNNETFQLAHITAFLPFSDGTTIRENMEDHLAAAVMAIYHFNNPELSPHLTEEDLQDCNIKFTVELYDTRFSAIDSTRRFTNILQRNNVLSNPLPAGVIGAYRSAVTSPLAILTGVNDIPQISYASTSTDFDVKEQYPLFGRTIQSSTGEALVALELFKSLGANYVGVLFVTDAFGSALQKAFQDAASAAGILTDSVAFSFSAGSSSTEIWNAVESLKKTQFRLFFVIAFEVHYESIMTAALEQGLIGDDFLWIFDGMDSANFQSFAVYEPGSPLDRASRGVGIINVEGGLRPEILYPGVENVPPLQENPTSSYEKFRVAWRRALNDTSFDTYSRSLVPEDQFQDIKGYSPNFKFGLEPTSYVTLLYDAITGLGLSYCRAANGTTGQPFGGQDVFNNFANLDFDGASGEVEIINPIGTRNFTTLIFTLFNVRDGGLDKDGNNVYNLVPTSFYEQGWSQIEGRNFVYAGGNTETPADLPDPNVNENKIGPTGRAIGYTLMVMVFIGAIAAFAWMVLYRKERAVRSAQPLFLFMVALGSFVMASTIVPLSLEEPVSYDGLNSSCMAAPWLYVSGAVLAFSSLLAKTRGVHHAYLNPDLDFIHVTSFDLFGTFGILYLVNFIILITWQFVSPLEWNRMYRDSTDIFNRPIESYGTCSSDDSLIFVILILVFNILTLMVANWWAYQARNIETEYHESRYIGISMASVLQAWCMGIPILIVVWDNPQAKFFVQAGIIFVTALAVLLLIFVPKMIAIRTDRIQAAEEEKRKAYTTFTTRAKKKDFEAEVEAEDEDKPKPEDAYSNDSGTKATSDASPEVLGALAVAEEGTQKSGEFGAPGRPSTRGTDDPLDPQSTTSNRSLRAIFAEKISKSMRFSSGAIHMDADADSGSQEMAGIRITHNPRSSRNLDATEGHESSRAQMEYLEDQKQYDADAPEEEGDDHDGDNDAEEEKDAEGGLQ